MATPLVRARAIELQHRVAAHNEWLRLTRYQRNVRIASVGSAAIGFLALGLPDLFVAFVPWAMATTWSSLYLRDTLDLRAAAGSAKPLVPLPSVFQLRHGREITLEPADLHPLHDAEHRGTVPPSTYALCLRMLNRRDEI